MAELIRAVAAHPWTSVWVFLAIQITIIMIGAQFKDAILRVHLFHTNMPSVDHEPG